MAAADAAREDALDVREDWVHDGGIGLTVEAHMAPAPIIASSTLHKAELLTDVRTTAMSERGASVRRTLAPLHALVRMVLAEFIAQGLDVGIRATRAQEDDPILLLLRARLLGKHGTILRDGDDGISSLGHGSQNGCAGGMNCKFSFMPCVQ